MFPPPEAVAFGSHLAHHRHGRGWSAYVAATAAKVSESTVRNLESGESIYITRGSPGGEAFAVELYAAAIGCSLRDHLPLYFQPEQLAQSAVWARVNFGQTARPAPVAMSAKRSLRSFVAQLPTDLDDLLNFPGIAGLRNAEAFAFLFALERSLPGLEMSIVHEAPAIFFQPQGIRQWATAMDLDDEDAATFQQLVRDYQIHFRQLIDAERKRYRVIVTLESFQRSLLAMSRPNAAALLDDMMAMLAMRTFELRLLDLRALNHDELLASVRLDEMEILSSYMDVPRSLRLTLPISIRKTASSAPEGEYSVVPLSGGQALANDIASFMRLWDLAEQLGRARFPDDHGNDLTRELLAALRPTVPGDR